MMNTDDYIPRPNCITRGDLKSLLETAVSKLDPLLEVIHSQPSSFSVGAKGRSSYNLLLQIRVTGLALQCRAVNVVIELREYWNNTENNKQEWRIHNPSNFVLPVPFEEQATSLLATAMRELRRRISQVAQAGLVKRAAEERKLQAAGLPAGVSNRDWGYHVDDEGTVRIRGDVDTLLPLLKSILLPLLKSIRQ